MSFTAQITADIGGFSKGIDQAVKEIDKLQKTVEERLSDIGKSMVNVGKRASILSAAVVAAGAKAYSMAADFEDALGATDQVFKDASDSVKDWANGLKPMYGIAKKEALEYSNLMGSMLVNIGKLTEEQAAKQSASLIELAGDLTAMYGGNVQDAVRALTGALKGNNTMLDNYGMAVNEALIKTKALEMGLISQGREMTLQAKQAATLALIYEQTGAAQGQAAREADGASGSMRALKTEITNLSTEIGEVLLPIITPIIAKMRDVVSVIRTMSPEMQSLVVGIAGVTAAIGPLLVGLGKLLQLLPKIRAAAIALTGPLGAIGVTMAVAAVNFHKNVDMMKTDWDFFSNHLETTSSAMGDVLNGNFNSWWGKVQSTFSNNIELLKAKFQQIKEYYTGVDKLSESAIKAANAGMKIGGLAQSIEKLSPDKLEILRLNDEITRLEESLLSAANGAKETINAFTDGSNVYDLVRRTSDEITVLTQRLEGLRNGTIAVQNVKKEIEETEQRVNDLSSTLDLLTGSRDLNINLKIGSGADAWGDVKNKILTPVVIPPIDTSLVESSMGKFEQLSNEVLSIAESFNYAITSSISDGMQKIIEGVMSVEGVNVQSVVSAILTPLGNLAIQLGEIAIATGIGLGAIKKAFESMNPYVAIAAGVALIALGSAIKGAVSSMGRNMGSGGGYSGGTSSYNNVTSPGTSEYRGPWQDDFNVEFVIKGDNLVGVLDTAQQRRKRL